MIAMGAVILGLIIINVLVLTGKISESKQRI
jgi:hypothetical protein